MAKGLLIGVDGGGTHSTAVAAWEDGRVAGVAYGEGLNFHNTGIPLARRRLEAMVAQLRRSAQAPVLEVCAGLSALDGPGDAATCQSFAQGELAGTPLDLQSDAYIALAGLTQGGPGMIVICGTGSMLLLTDAAGAQQVSGGWGYLLGDAGSGYTLAREGLLAVIDQQDGVGPPTALTPRAQAYFGVGPIRQLIPRVYAPDCTPDRLAGFAREVLAAAQAGDGPAGEIVMRNMSRLARQAAALLQKAPEARQVGLYGGVFRHSALAREGFTAALAALCPQAEAGPLRTPPELGAVMHLLRKRGLMTPQAAAALHRTYKEVLA